MNKKGNETKKYLPAIVVFFLFTVMAISEGLFGNTFSEFFGTIMTILFISGITLLISFAAVKSSEKKSDEIRKANEEQKECERREIEEKNRIEEERIAKQEEYNRWYNSLSESEKQTEISRQKLEIEKQKLEMEQKKIQMQQESINLQMQTKSIHEKQYQESQASRKIQEKQYESMAKCPRCGSTSLSGNKKGYGVVKGGLGALALGAATGGVGAVIGLGAGNIGRKKVIVTCLKCGKKFKL